MSSQVKIISPDAPAAPELSISSPKELDDSRGGFQFVPRAFGSRRVSQRQRILEAETIVRLSPVPPSPPSSEGSDECDGAGPSRRRRRRESPATFFASTAFAATLLGQDRHLGAAEKCTISDANDGDGEGQLTMNCKSGLLGLTDHSGEVFVKMHEGWIIKDKKRVGEYFSLQSSTNPDLYLAMNSSTKTYVVQGMSLSKMRDKSDRYWAYVWYYKIGGGDPTSPYIALRYWGNSLGQPAVAEYYFVIELKDSVPYRIDSRVEAIQYGRLGLNPR